jgi:PIN domain nuclease of toxin-antitoxin system
MTLLLDVHTFLWFCQGDPALSTPATLLIQDPSNRKLLSIASCWEIAIKTGLGKLTLGESSATYISNALRRTGFELLPISLSHATTTETLPLHHRDPFDRLLVAQAIVEDVAIVSIDSVFDLYGITRYWRLAKLDRPRKPMRAANIVTHAINPWSALGEAIKPIDDPRHNTFDWESWHECDVFRAEIEREISRRR